MKYQDAPHKRNPDRGWGVAQKDGKWMMIGGDSGEPVQVVLRSNPGVRLVRRSTGRLEMDAAR